MAAADNATKIEMYTAEIKGYQDRINEIFSLGDARRLDFEADFRKEVGEVIFGYFDEATGEYVEGQFEEEYYAAE